MMDWTRRLCLVFLLAAWVLAVGGHDLALSEHRHDESSHEIVLAQNWHWDAGLTAPTMIAAVMIVLLVVLADILCRQRMFQGVRPVPERHHSPPRPPNLQQLFFRGPPLLTLQQAKSRNWMENRARKLHKSWLDRILRGN